MTACPDGEGEGGSSVDSQTHWLRPCEDDSQCGEAYQCLCGICTVTCEEDQACGGTGTTSQCFVAVEGIGDELCTLEEGPAGICLPDCSEDNPCRDGEVCAQGACVPEEREPECRAEVLVEDVVDSEEVGALLLHCEARMRECGERTEDMSVVFDGAGSFAVTCGCSCDEPEAPSYECNPESGDDILIVAGDAPDEEARDALLSWCAEQAPGCPGDAPVRISQRALRGEGIACVCDCPDPEPDPVCEASEFVTLESYELHDASEFADIQSECQNIGAESCQEGYVPQLRGESSDEERLVLSCDCVCDAQGQLCEPPPEITPDLCREGQVPNPIFDRDGCILAWGCVDLVCEDINAPECEPGVEQLVSGVDDRGCPTLQCEPIEEVSFPCGEQDECMAPFQVCMSSVDGAEPTCNEAPAECILSYNCDCIQEFLEPSDCTEQNGIEVSF